MGIYQLNLGRSLFCGRAVRLNGHIRCCAQKQIQFAKYQGLGNDFILIDNRDVNEPKLTPKEATELCDRNFGVGGDGVIFVLPAKDDSDYQMRLFNSDGSEPEMCGNGIRCVAKFVAMRDGMESGKYKVATLAGLIQPEILSNGLVQVDMGEPVLEGSKIPTTLPPTVGGSRVVQQELIVEGVSYLVTCVNMGNPHAVIYSSQFGNIVLKDIKLEDVGPKFENNAVFPQRINTEFVEVVSPTHVKMVVWERGSGITLACGTGACALVVAGILEGRLDRSKQCLVELPGGPLEILWSEEDNHVYMTGPAKVAFEGTVLLDDQA